MSNATRFFFEYGPIRLKLQDPPRISRACRDASSLDVWMIDAVSSRGPTSLNHQRPPGDATAFLDTTHMPWFTRSLLDSMATLKLMSSAMPLSHELKLAALPHVIKTKDITHAVWSTAGVHHAAAHVDDAASAQFTDGHPPWAVVAALFHDGFSGLNTLDTPCIVRPQVLCPSIPEGAAPKASPPAGLPCLERVAIHRIDAVMTVSFLNVQGRPNDSIDRNPEASRACP